MIKFKYENLKFRVKKKYVMGDLPNIYKLYDKIIKTPSKSHEKIPLEINSTFTLSVYGLRYYNPVMCSKVMYAFTVFCVYVETTLKIDKILLQFTYENEKLQVFPS
jgi:hypothetical protein